MEMAQKGKLNEIVSYLDQLKESKPTKRTRNSYTTFLEPVDHVGYDALFDNIRSRYVNKQNLLACYSTWKKKKNVRHKYGSTNDRIW